MNKKFILIRIFTNIFAERNELILKLNDMVIIKSCCIECYKRTAVFFIILIIVLLSLTGCCYSKNVSEPWEGITCNTLKITISEFFPFEENVSTDLVKQQINERLNQRASLIIASYISINMPRNKISRENDLIFNKMIDKIISSGNLSDYECYENNYCRAHINYDISEVQNKLKELSIK